MKNKSFDKITAIKCTLVCILNGLFIIAIFTYLNYNKTCDKKYESASDLEYKHYCNNNYDNDSNYYNDISSETDNYYNNIDGNDE